MDPNQLSKFFPPSTYVDNDTGMAINNLYAGAAEFADLLQRLLPESQKKFDLHMNIVGIVREAEFALRLDGPKKSPISVVKQ